jgi:hypothetical protein
MLLLNVPATTNYQYAMNTITGSWTVFRGWNARCFEVLGTSLYFGGTGVVCLAWTGNTDNSASITAKCLPAFYQFGTGTQLKKINMVRPILYSDGTPSLLIGMNYDYDQISTPTGVLSFAPPSGMVWGSMTWGTMLWGGTLQAIKNWQFSAGLGYSAAMGITCQNNASEVHWASTDYMYELGGVL